MLETNLLNLGILDLVKRDSRELDIDFREVVEAEHDMALGNGGLGRLAAASWIHLRLPVIQVLVMVFVTVTDFSNNVLWMVTKWNYRWLVGSTGNVWETRKDHDIVYVKLFGDVVLESNEDGRFVPTYKNAQVLRAVPYDVPQIGYKNGVINNLRLWDVEIPEEYELDYPTLEARVV